MLSENPIAKMQQIEVLCIEDLVSEDHLLRNVDKAINFKFIYEMVREMMFKLFKNILMYHLCPIGCAILSLRDISKEKT